MIEKEESKKDTSMDQSRECVILKAELIIFIFFWKEIMIKWVYKWLVWVYKKSRYEKLGTGRIDKYFKEFSIKKS